MKDLYLGMFLTKQKQLKNIWNDYQKKIGYQMPYSYLLLLEEKNSYIS